MTDEEYIEKVYNSIYKDYPEVLTLDESDRFENFETFTKEEDNRKTAIEFAKKVSGIVYTQVDGDYGSVVYDRGFHIVNRTGVYAVAWKPGLSKDKTTFCAFCDSEAVAKVDGTGTPLCATCRQAYESGQENPDGGVEVL